MRVKQALIEAILQSPNKLTDIVGSGDFKDQQVLERFLKVTSF